MAANKSDDSRYQSKYGGPDCYVTPAQLIAELMCERLAKKDKKTLPMQFWNTDAWKRTFKLQILAANGLLKIYSPKAILAGLRKAWNVYSLRAPWLQPILQEEEAKVQADIEKSEVSSAIPTPSPAQVSTTEKPRESFKTGKSTLNKLRDLDG